MFGLFVRREKFPIYLGTSVVSSGRRFYVVNASDMLLICLNDALKEKTQGSSILWVWVFCGDPTDFLCVWDGYGD